MASSETGTIVEGAVEDLYGAPFTVIGVRALRRRPRRDIPGVVITMFGVLNEVASDRGKQWQSRKRIRSDALRLFKEGAFDA